MPTPGTRSARVRNIFDGGALGRGDDRKRGEAGRGGSSPIELGAPGSVWVQLPLTPQLAEPVHDEAALAEVAARVREAVG